MSKRRRHGQPSPPEIPIAPPFLPLNPYAPPPFLGPFPEYVLHPELSGCAWYDYIKCGVLIAAASTACVVTESPRLCFEAVGAAIAAGCWDCLPGGVKDVVCKLCTLQPVICPEGIKIRCRVGTGERHDGDEREKCGDCCKKPDCRCSCHRGLRGCRDEDAAVRGPYPWPGHAGFTYPYAWPGYQPWPWNYPYRGGKSR